MHFFPSRCYHSRCTIATYDTSRIPLSLPVGALVPAYLIHTPATSLMCPTGAHCDRSTKFLEGWLGCVACSPILSVSTPTHGRRKKAALFLEQEGSVVVVVVRENPIRGRTDSWCSIHPSIPPSSSSSCKNKFCGFRLLTSIVD